MATSITITITPTRALTVEGRLVAGETAEVTIGGATPNALYLVAPDQTVIAACEAFTPTGQGTGGTGFLQLSTEQVAALFANTPAGRMVAVWALVNDADGVAGAGWIPVVSAPMPDELVDLDIDFYLRASQVGAGLAIVDGKIVCTVNPETYLTKTEAAQTYATQTALEGKVNADGSTPMTGPLMIEDGQTGVFAQYGDGGVVVGDSQHSYGLVFPQKDGTLATTGDIPAVPVQSVNGQTGAVALSSGDIPVNPGAPSSVLDALNLLANRIPYAIGATITASAQLADRTGNRVVPLATNTENIVLTFPNGYADYLRDFLVLVTNTAGNTGNITFTAPAGATVYGDGFTHSPASEETWLYSVTEVAADTFWVKSVKMEVAQ